MNKGDTIPSGNDTYTIVRPLGSGATSEVYLATTTEGVQVALKVLRSHVPQTIIDSFFLEAKILDEFKIAEENFDGVRAIPERYKTEREGEVKFLAQEFVFGRSLEDLLDDSPYYLKEPVALKITFQVARVLHLLHTELKRSYTDFQLKNIYWEESCEHVRVLDWNHVSDLFKNRTPEDEKDANRLKQADLSRLGIYLYKMLTGKAADPQGEKERSLATRAGKDRWDAISEGTRRLVLCMLHPNPEKRFASAAALREEVGWLVEQWAKQGTMLATDVFTIIKPLQSNLNSLSLTNLEPLSGLVPEIKRLFSDPSIATQPDQHTNTELLGFAECAVKRARMMVDLAPRGESPPPPEALRSIEKMVEKSSAAIREQLKGGTDPFGAGRTFYDTCDYGRAYDRWMIAAKETDLLDHWRWVQVALTGRDKLGVLALPNVRERIAEALKAMKEEQYEQAAELLRKIQAQVPLDALHAELDARRLIDEARQMERTAVSPEECLEAAQKYDEAERKLQRIP